MFVGHYAPALALKAVTPRAPLWALLLAAQLVDVAFFLLVFVDVERVKLTPGGHPSIEVASGVVTHSLASTPAWAALGLALGWALAGPRAGAAIAVAVASHWLLDLVVHVPDLPLGLTQQPAAGLGLWTHPALSLALEVGLVLGAYALLRPRLERPRRADRLVVGLVAAQLLQDLVVPLPPTPVLLGVSALLAFSAVSVAGWWVERPATA